MAVVHCRRLRPSEVRAVGRCGGVAWLTFLAAQRLRLITVFMGYVSALLSNVSRNDTLEFGRSFSFLNVYASLSSTWISRCVRSHQRPDMRSSVSSSPVYTTLIVPVFYNEDSLRIAAQSGYLHR